MIPSPSCRAACVQAGAALICSLLITTAGAQTIPTSYPTGAGPANVSYGADGKLSYVYESNGDTIINYSNAGYKGGAVSIPSVPVVTTLTAVGGDNKSRIQNAINSLASQPVGPDGFRGAILLKRGVYEISGTIKIQANGIVLRGEGDSSTGTILRLTSGSRGTPLIQVSDTTSPTEVSGTRHNLADSYVPVGANWVKLDSVSGLAVGDSVYIVRPSPLEWLDTIFMDSYWSPGEIDMKWDRTIVAIEGPRVLFDAPLTESFEQQFGGGYVYKYSYPGRVQNVGIESIRGEATIELDAQGNTGGAFVRLDDLVNGWVRKCTNNKMKGQAGQYTTIGAFSTKWITIEDVNSTHNSMPSGTSGSAELDFTMSTSQLVLFHRCTGKDCGMEFATGKQNPGPNVFLESKVTHSYSFSGPQNKWSNGTLYDSLYLKQQLSIHKWGGSNGWAGANLLGWNVESSSSYRVERPFTAHQWMFGCISPQSSPPQNTNGKQNGEWRSFGTHVEPGSLYRAQLEDRVGSATALTVLGKPGGDNYYWLTSGGSNTITAGDTTTYSATVTVSSDFGSGSVAMSTTGLPSGATASFSPSSFTSTGSTTVTINTIATTAPGTYNVTIKATGSFPTITGGTINLTRRSVVQLVILPPFNGFFEAETLAVENSSGDTVRLLPEGAASGGSSQMVDSNAVGDFVTFRIPNVPAGTYTVKVKLKKHPSRGIVQTQIGKIGGSLGNIGATIDLYNASVVFQEYTLGTWTPVTTSDKQISFKITGKNSSSSGYTECIDYIKLEH